MKYNLKKAYTILSITCLVICISVSSFAHSGRTDSSGGHKDNQNKSGLGSYHYHCGGNPAHLHTNGVCPYSSSASETRTSSSSSTKTSTTVVSTVDVTEIAINENIGSIKVGESKLLTAVITPSNATDKNITWKSSDRNIATISSTGELIAKKSGTVEITATSANGKTSTIKINIKEEQKTENTVIVRRLTTRENNISNNTTVDKQEDSDTLGEILTIGLLGCGGYLGYKKYKKSKNG